MKRREFIALTTAAVVAPMMAQAAFVSYTPGLIDERLAAGDTVFVDFKASWCSTCRAQERAINALKSSNPAYQENITFIAVDWDTYKNDPIVQRYNVPRRSTLIMLRGDQELGRIVADTRKDTIKALLDSGLPENA
ncbi:thioredoxin family protein [Pseudaestuariivita rosea]|uniref:thioredoxin family protein n=1 Tax=Pseudaestuariivita rosea TaxID=2763263 RepID=UPI001ABB22DB|nr:thioredoxin family protein [Pseudaestuariivita rosea]